MITAGDFRKGTTFEMDGNVYNVIDFLHVKPGKGSPFVRAKIKNVMTGQVREDTFNPSDKFQDAVIEKKEMLYLYNDGELYYFMDNETYEQMPLNKESVADALNFVTENILLPRSSDSVLATSAKFSGVTILAIESIKAFLTATKLSSPSPRGVIFMIWLAFTSRCSRSSSTNTICQPYCVRNGSLMALTSVL